MVSVLLIGFGLVAVSFANGIGNAIGNLIVRLWVEPKVKSFHKKLGGV